MILKRTFSLTEKFSNNQNKNKSKGINLKSLNLDNKEKKDIIIPKKLSNYINSEINHKFINKNKSALKEYEIFLNRFKKNKRNLTTFGSVNNNYQYQSKMSIYKNNPRLIISSFKTNFKSNRTIRYHNNILGVDEGLIILPKKKLEDENQNKEIIIKDNINNLSNSETNSDNDNNIEINQNNNYKRIKSVKHSKKINNCLLERGEELITKVKRDRNKSKDFEYYNNILLTEKKNNRTIEDLLHFNNEIRRLNKWDFIHLAKEKEENNEMNRKKKSKDILLEINHSERMNWVMDIKNDKEQYNLICRNKHLKDFIKKINDEQNAIFMKNIRVIKKGFNFNVFNNTENNAHSENEKIVNIENTYSNRKSDSYTGIMKEKYKLEDTMNKEVEICAEEVYKFKKKIKEKKEIINDLMNNLNKVNKIEEEEKKEYEKNVKRLDSLLQNLEASMNSKNSENKYSNENKNYNLKFKELFSKLSKNKERRNSTSLNLNIGKIQKFLIIDAAGFSKVRTLANHNNNDKSKKSKKRYSNISNLNLENKNNNNNNIKTKEEELIIRNNLLSQKTSLDIEHKEKSLKIKKEKDEIKENLNNVTKEMNELSKELIISKKDFNEHVQSLSDYYYQILKKGIDVRQSGLSWVIIKLMELNAYIDYSHFPNFLDQRQIDYLMKIGIKVYEVKELIKLFQLFKKREKLIKENHYNETRNKEKKEKEEKLNEIKRKNKNKIGNNYSIFFDEIQEKYDYAINFNIDEEIEDKNINKTSDYLKEIILRNNGINKELYYIPGSLAEYFSKDKKFREYFDDVYYLNEEINKRKREIRKDKDNEIKYYRKKYKSYFLGNNNLNENNLIKSGDDINKYKDSINYMNKENKRDYRQMILSALFGNGTII